MRGIRILDTHTINKIAAGEVVERPCSVVKELVENSVDAQASSITVEIKNGGIDLIRVTDNGIGIPSDQVEIAFLRHATSKITQAEDLYEVKSLGFRGEALASIAAVAHVEILTKVKEAATGKRLEIAGGKIESSEEVACPNGTTFIMRHLFFNVPARKAFLSSAATEAGKISDYMYKLALAHPEIAFKYIQNGKVVFSTSGDHELKHCVLNIYGKEYAKNTFECYYKQDEMTCVGLLGAPTLNRSNRNYEHFFINGRYIKSKILQDAVEEAYKTLAMVGKFPFVILHLQINPSVVDVNVHPTKLQVRFTNVDAIYQLVYKAASKVLSAQYLVPDVDLDRPRGDAKVQPVMEQEGIDTFFAPRKENNTATPSSLLQGSSEDKVRPLPETNPYKPTPRTIERLFGQGEVQGEIRQSINTAHLMSPSEKDEALDANNVEEVSASPLVAKAMAKEDHLQASYQIAQTPISQVEEPVYQVQENLDSVKAAQIAEPVAQSSYKMPMDYRIVGQLFKTYWLIQYHEKVFIIDQHAAHERILYEQFMNYFKSGDIATQVLLMPETVHLTGSEKALVLENSGLFKELGFGIELLGESDVVIREVPYLLNEPIKPGVFKEILDEMAHQKITHLADVKAEQIIRMSCRSAIKAHDPLSDAECHKLIHRLMALDNPFTCPHGRPTIVALKQGDIEKMFKRIQ